MSPEQAAGRAAVFASDQFSFGVILRAADRPAPVRRGHIGRDAQCDHPRRSSADRDAQPRRSGLAAATRRAVPGQAAGASLRRHAADRGGVARSRGPATAARGAAGRSVRLASSGGRPACAEGPTPPLARGGLVLSIVAAGTAWWLWPTRCSHARPAVCQWRCRSGRRTSRRRHHRKPDSADLASALAVGDGAQHRLNFKGKPIDPREVGRQLGVDAILTGTVSSAIPAAAYHRGARRCRERSPAVGQRLRPARRGPRVRSRKRSSTPSSAKACVSR